MDFGSSSRQAEIAAAGHTVALPIDSRIGKYTVTSVLGAGGFGVTYRARDTQLDREVAIKEFLPTSMAARAPDMAVLPHSTHQAKDFRWGRERFLAEAQTLARLEHARGIVSVHDFLEANGTAYMVMALVPGETLEARLQRDGRLTQSMIERLLHPLLDGLERVHRTGFLHRDIKPANILIDADGAPVLIDFGAARVALQGRTHVMTAVYTPGYAAIEQMSAAAPQGPWTDIYALASTLYRCIGGAPPPSALDRVMDDRLVPAAEIGRSHYKRGLLAAIDAGLRLKADDRPRSIAHWRPLFAGPAPILRASREESLIQRRVDPAPPRRLSWLWPAVAALAVCVAGGAGAWVAIEETAAKAKAAAEARSREAAAAAVRKAPVEARPDTAVREKADRGPAARQVALDTAPLPQGQAFRDCPQCPEIVMVPPGAFMMGSTAAEDEREGVPPSRREYTMPAHRVTVAAPFALGKYPVTRGEFAAFVAATGHLTGNFCLINAGDEAETTARNWRNPGFAQNDRHPAVCVSADDARAYVAWLTKVSGKPYRLPTEAEWEYAARAGSTTARAWGDSRTDACRHANVLDLTIAKLLDFDIAKDGNVFACTDQYVYTSPVDAFPANRWGLHDMLGNVYQLASDCWHPGYRDAPADGRSWEEGGDCARRVIRGGSWQTNAWATRIAARGSHAIGVRTAHAGFRVARDN